MKIKKLSVFGLVVICFLLSSCHLRYSTRHRFSSNGQPRIDIDLIAGDREAISSDEVVYERNWDSPHFWYPKSSSKWLNLQVFFVLENSGGGMYTTGTTLVDYDADITWPMTKGDGERVGMFFESGLGKMTFAGQIGNKGKRWGKKIRSFGTVSVEGDKIQLQEIENAFGHRPSLEMLMKLILKNVNAGKINEYANTGIKFTIEQAGTLVESDYSADNIKKLVDDGYKFKAEDFVKLARYNVSYGYIIDWKENEFELSADKLVYAMQRNLSADTAKRWTDAGFDVNVEDACWISQRNLNSNTAVAWSNAGYKLNLEQLYWISQRNLNPDTATAWKKAGYQVSLEDIYWIGQRNLNPDTAVAWSNAGYKLNLKQLYWIGQRNLSARQAGIWKNGGYDFSLEELYKLSQYNIGVEFGLAFADPDYQQLTVDELVKFKNSRISRETIMKLRKQKPANYPFAGDWQGSGSDSQGNKYTFAAKVMDMGDGKFRMLVLDKLDTEKRPMHTMDGELINNKFPHTADNGIYTGSGELTKEEFTGYYKGPVDGTYKMQRVK